MPKTDVSVAGREPNNIVFTAQRAFREFHRGGEKKRRVLIPVEGLLKWCHLPHH